MRYSFLSNDEYNDALRNVKIAVSQEPIIKSMISYDTFNADNNICIGSIIKENNCLFEFDGIGEVARAHKHYAKDYTSFEKTYRNSIKNIDKKVNRYLNENYSGLIEFNIVDDTDSIRFNIVSKKPFFGNMARYMGNSKDLINENFFIAKDEYDIF